MIHCSMEAIESITESMKISLTQLLTHFKASTTEFAADCTMDQGNAAG